MTVDVSCISLSSVMVLTFHYMLELTSSVQLLEVIKLATNCLMCHLMKVTSFDKYSWFQRVTSFTLPDVWRTQGNGRFFVILFNLVSLQLSKLFQQVYHCIGGSWSRRFCWNTRGIRRCIMQYQMKLLVSNLFIAPCWYHQHLVME